MWISRDEFTALQLRVTQLEDKLTALKAVSEFGVGPLKDVYSTFGWYQEYSRYASVPEVLQKLLDKLNLTVEATPPSLQIKEKAG
jgi:hypothetical protein